MQPTKQNARLRVIASSASVLLLLACAIGAAATFWPDAITSIAWTSPFEWDAPMRTVTKNAALESAAIGSKSSTPVLSRDGEVVVLDDWNYTAISVMLPAPSSKR